MLTDTQNQPVKVMLIEKGKADEGKSSLSFKAQYGFFNVPEMRIQATPN
jgi:hypothetical protein